MIIRCDQCDTKYRLDESLLEKEGSKVRCSNCKYIFTAHPDPAPNGGEAEKTDGPVDSPYSLPDEDSGTPPLPPGEEPVGAFSEDDHFDIDDSVWETPDENGMEIRETASSGDFNRQTHEPNFDSPNSDDPAFGQSNMGKPDFDQPDFDEPGVDTPDVDQRDFDEPDFDQANFDEPDFDETDFDKPEFDKPEFDKPEFDEPEFDQIDPFIAEDEKSSGIRLFFLMLLMLGIFIGALSGGFFILNRMGVHIPYVGKFLKTADRLPISQKIETFDLKSRTLAVAGGEKRLVITGQVKNNTAVPRRFIEATATLYTGKKDLLKTKKVICGNVLSDLELTTLDMSVIDETLQRLPEITEPNKSRMFVETLPFMAVFDGFTDQVEMFVVDAAIFVETPAAADAAQ